MKAKQGLVFVSFFAKNKNSVVQKTCEAVLNQLRPFQSSHPELELWDRSKIPAGCNKAEEINAALRRCIVAVLLVSSDYLASEHWEKEAKPLLAAAKEGKIRLLWQQINSCNYGQEISEYKQMKPEVLLSQQKPVAKREASEQEISQIIFNEWRERFHAFSQAIGGVDLPDAPPAAPVRPSCDTVALMLGRSGIEKRKPDYQWKAFVQKAGKNQYEAISNGIIGAQSLYSKEQLPELLQCLKSWIRKTHTDTPVLEIFACDDLLETDWGNISIHNNEERFLHTHHPYLLRSLSRLINPEWNERGGALKRMHQHLVEGTGAWLPPEDLTKLSLLQTLSGEAPPNQEGGGDVVSAIRCLQAEILTTQTGWLHAVLESMAPLVVWPSRHSALTEEQVQSCLSQLPLNRGEASQAAKVDRPHCPDLAQLAKARLQLSHRCSDLRGLTILVEHPERRPDPQHLQGFSRVSRAPAEAEPPDQPPSEPSQASRAPAGMQPLPLISI